MFLIMYESRRADLLYPLLLDQGLCGGGNAPQLRAIRLAVLRLLTTLLRTNKVSMRHSECFLSEFRDWVDDLMIVGAIILLHLHAKDAINPSYAI